MTICVRTSPLGPLSKCFQDMAGPASENLCRSFGVGHDDGGARLESSVFPQYLRSARLKTFNVKLKEQHLEGSRILAIFSGQECLRQSLATSGLMHGIAGPPPPSVVLHQRIQDSRHPTIKSVWLSDAKSHDVSFPPRVCTVIDLLSGLFDPTCAATVPSM